MAALDLKIQGHYGKDTDEDEREANAMLGACLHRAPDSADIEETSGKDGTNIGEDGGDACDVTGASGDGEMGSDIETQDDDAFGDKRGDVTGYKGSTDIYTGSVDIGMGRRRRSTWAGATCVPVQRQLWHGVRAEAERGRGRESFGRGSVSTATWRC